MSLGERSLSDDPSLPPTPLLVPLASPLSRGCGCSSRQVERNQGREHVRERRRERRQQGRHLGPHHQRHGDARHDPRHDRRGRLQRPARGPDHGAVAARHPDGRPQPQQRARLPRGVRRRPRRQDPRDRQAHGRGLAVLRLRVARDRRGDGGVGFGRWCVCVVFIISTFASWWSSRRAARVREGGAEGKPRVACVDLRALAVSFRALVPSLTHLPPPSPTR